VLWRVGGCGDLECWRGGVVMSGGVYERRGAMTVDWKAGGMVRKGKFEPVRRVDDG
jgi:hypothetical protein